MLSAPDYYDVSSAIRTIDPYCSTASEYHSVYGQPDQTIEVAGGKIERYKIRTRPGGSSAFAPLFLNVAMFGLWEVIIGGSDLLGLAIDPHCRSANAVGWGAYCDIHISEYYVHFNSTARDARRACSEVFVERGDQPNHGMGALHSNCTSAYKLALAREIGVDSPMFLDIAVHMENDKDKMVPVTSLLQRKLPEYSLEQMYQANREQLSEICKP